MTTPTSHIVEQAIAKTEAEEAGIATDDLKDKGTDDDKKTTDDAKDDKSATGKDDKSAGDPGDAAPKYDKEGKRIEPDKSDESDESKKTETDKPELDKDGKPIEEPKEGEFTADDAIETEAPKATEPAAPTDTAGVRLSTAEQKHIVDNIGEPIVIRGMRGEGDAAKEVEIKAYGPNDIPTDFKFANDQQRTAAATAFYNIEQRANKLLGEFRQSQSVDAAQDFERRENEGIKDDVAELQKDGRFPKFTVRPGESGFDDSREAKQMGEVLNLMNERNENYLKQYNQGRPYRHIGFMEAFELWEAKSPDRQASRQADVDQKKEDDERRERGAEHSNTNRGMNPSNIVKPTIRPGTTTRDIMARIDADESY